MKQTTIKKGRPKYVGQGIIVFYRVNRVSRHPVRTVLQTYKMVKRLWSKELKDLQEQVMVLYLDKDNYLIGYRLLNTGTMGACMVDIKLLVSISLGLMASGVVLVHNHPSEKARPSPEDVRVTFRIHAILSLVDTVLVDHLILSKSGYYSFKEKGNLW